MRQYGRDDVDYETWYSPWMKRLALSNTREELELRLHGCKADAERAGMVHLRAIEATTSMTGCSARRAHARNVVAAAGDTAIALRGALEIYELFPEHTAAEVKPNAELYGERSESERTPGYAPADNKGD